MGWSLITDTGYSGLSGRYFDGFDEYPLRLNHAKRARQAVPHRGKNFLKWRLRPIARRLEIPESLITFQVLRRSLGTNLQHHGTLKDAQGALRHASIQTTGDVYVQSIEVSVLGDEFAYERDPHGMEAYDRCGHDCHRGRGQ